MSHFLAITYDTKMKMITRFSGLAFLRRMIEEGYDVDLNIPFFEDINTQIMLLLFGKDCEEDEHGFRIMGPLTEEEKEYFKEHAPKYLEFEDSAYYCDPLSIEIKEGGVYMEVEYTYSPFNTAYDELIKLYGVITVMKQKRGELQ